MALKCDCGGEIRETIDNKDECIICGTTIIITKKGDDDMAKIPEQTYVEIAEPFGKQFRDAIREAYARGYADGKQIGEMLREESTKEKVCDVQRQRDRIVEKAKDEVENIFIEGNHGVGKVVDTMFGHCKVEFVVNKEKRTVIALLRGAYAKAIFAKGIAKCAPGDCFNVHIGKAIALRKALGKSIDDYMIVPNPTEVRVGDIVVWKHSPDKLYKVTKVDGDYYNFIRLDTGRRYKDAYYKTLFERIIDDSREVSE